jgi:glycosyltransferase involved in cell wall biosynthesis
MRANPRYRWLGELSRGRTLRLMSRCRLLVLTSKAEGGANVIAESIVCGTPVLSSRIDGTVGILGVDYPGYFPVGSTRALTALLERAERDASFYGSLEARCRKIRSHFDPVRERGGWASLLASLESRRRVA